MPRGIRREATSPLHRFRVWRSGPAVVVPPTRVADRPRNGTCWAPCLVDIATRLLIGRICNKDILAFFERAIEFALGKKLASAFETHSRFFVDDGR